MTRRVLAYILIGTLVFFIGYQATPPQLKMVDNPGLRAEYPLLAKRLFIDSPNDSLVNFASLREQLRQYQQTQGIEGSIYFEYLPTGTSIRIDGDAIEVAASLIKLPAAMELYKASELGKVNLDETITLEESWLDSEFGLLYQKGAGYRLTLREAVEIMLKDSDNTALKAVASKLNGLLDPSLSPFNFLDIDIVQNRDLTVSLSSRAYSSILKCLYFACYTSNDSSQEILDYLTDTSFQKRIVAGVNDEDIRVAHKTGNNENSTQSDCGIVYVPNRNYILCAMIEADTIADGDQKISAITKIVHEYIIGQ
jgi:beta-lactamase class A